MDRPTRKRNDGVVLFWAGATLAAALLIYLAGVGPACVALQRGYVSQQTLDTAYAPIIWLARKSDFVKGIGDWWVSWWSNTEP